MAKKSPGSFHLFRLLGIDVFVHWTWFLIAAIEYQTASQNSAFAQRLWYMAVYLALFGIVTLHEFGHALACRSVGGEAKRIILWPLGGIAFVNPPRRPGPVLWSIAAGPLVNVLLVPVTAGLAYAVGLFDTTGTWTDVQRFIASVGVINLLLLGFNLLPVYPLDGGQIFQAILWFFIGPIKSLTVASAVGMVGAIGGGIYAAMSRDWIVLAIAIFVGFQAFKGFKASRMMAEVQATADDRARHLAGVDQWNE